MNIERLKNIVEGFLFASDKPLTVEKIIKLFPEGEQPEKDTIVECIATLITDFENHGIELKEVKSGYRFQVRQENAPWVSKLWEEKPAKYTRAMLETLALIVYRQPITRGEIEEIRGVSVSSHIIRTMMDRDWIKVIGHRDVPGRPALYASTKVFLDYFNLSSLEDLPPLSEIKDLDAIATELDPEQNSALISAIREMQKETALENTLENTEKADQETTTSDEEIHADDEVNEVSEETVAADEAKEVLEQAIQNTETNVNGSDASTEAVDAEEVDIEKMEHIEEDLEIQISVASHDLEEIEEQEHEIEKTQKSFGDLLSNFGKSEDQSDEDEQIKSDKNSNSVESDT